MFVVGRVVGGVAIKSDQRSWVKAQIPQKLLVRFSFQAAKLSFILYSVSILFHLLICYILCTSVYEDTH